MAWLGRSLGDSVSSLTGQLSNLTKDILTEGTEEVSDHATELSLAKEQIISLQGVQFSLKTENEHLKSLNRELEEKAESAELQINTISREYRTLLEEKEKEINTLKHQHHELLEQHAKQASLSGEASHIDVVKDTDFATQEDFGSWSNESWGDFDDSLRLQREINHLRQELTRLRADNQHWRSVAGHLSEKNGQDVDQLTHHDLLNLQARVKELESQVSESREKAQHEIVLLQDVHQSKITTLKSRHKDEISRLKSHLSSLEQQVSDMSSRYGDSTGTAGSSSVLPESEREESESQKALRSQLAALTQERDKIQTARAHLEGELQELQTEVEILHTQRDAHHAKVAELECGLDLRQQEVASLQAKLEESELCLAQREQQWQQVGVDLVHAKQCLLDQLDATHADTADLLSDVRGVRQQLCSDAVRRQRHLLVEKQRMATRLYTSGVQENKLKSDIVEAGTHLQQVSADTDTLIEQLGTEEAHQHTANVVDSLERENLVLKEQSVKLQEQVLLLEKRLDSQQQEWQASHGTVASLSKELKQLQGDGASKSDNTLDQSVTSSADEVESLSTRSQTNQEGAASEWLAQREALEEALAQLRQEVREKDDKISQLSADGKEDSDEEEASLHERTKSLELQLSLVEEELSSLRTEKDELEMSIGELDEQHEEATNHLITARNSLQAELAQSQQQVKSLQEELQKLSEQQQQQQQSSGTDAPDSTADESPSVSPAEEVESLKQALVISQQEVEALRQQGSSMQEELTELRGKLQKGTLALNDLHMDKQDLETELGRRQEEVKGKVAAIKALREEKAGLAQRTRGLEERVQELEEELESWQQRNEDAQLVKAQVTELQAEVSALQGDRSAQQLRLDSMFAELDQSRALCRKLQAEKDRLDGGREEESGDSDETKRREQEGGSGDESSSHQTALQLKLDAALAEKTALQEEVRELRGQVLGEENACIPNLKLQSQQIVLALQRRLAALEKLKVDLNSGSQESDSASSGSETFVGQGVSELFLESISLMEAATNGNRILEEIQQQKSPGSSQTENVSALSASSSQTSAREVENLDGNTNCLSPEESGNLLGLIKERDAEIVNLKQSVESLQQEISANKHSSDCLSEKVQNLESVILEKDNELQILHSENSQLTVLCEESKTKIADSELKMKSLVSQLQETEVALQQGHSELDDLRQTIIQLSEENSVLKLTSTQLSEEHAALSKLEREVASARDTIQRLEDEVTVLQETVTNQKAGIEDLNLHCAQQSKSLEEEEVKAANQENVIALLRQTSETAEEERDTSKEQLSRAMTFLSPEQKKAVHGHNEDLPLTPTSNLPALEYPQRKALEMKHEAAVVQNGELDPSEESSMAQKHSDLLRQLQEKEEAISDLQQNNATLVQLLEAKSSGSSPGDSLQLEVHRLQAEVKSLKTEKEQILEVMNEKSREASSLKAEVMRLMSVVSAEKSALDKLQRDNQELVSRSTPPRDDSLEDMTREAMHRLSQLVRDREMEIEALKQKNDTLVAVLQDMNTGGGDGGAPHPERQGEEGGNSGPSLLAQLTDKQNLEKQLATLQAERDQMVAFVGQKHSESVAYHTEIQRLNGLRAEEGQRLEQMTADFEALRPQYEDKSRQLLKAQNDLINCRQKYAELEVKHGELLHRANASDTVDAASFRQAEEEKERLVGQLSELQQAIQGHEERTRSAAERAKELENSMLEKDAEISALRKQVDSQQFQLQGLGSETADLRQEQEQAEQERQEQRQMGHALQESNEQLTLAVREKDLELASLHDRLAKLTALLSQREGESTQVAQLVREQGAGEEQRVHLQQEVDHLTVALKQKQQQLNDLHAETLRLKEKEHKLIRELERLRTHLLQMEEGYTREALEAEEREKGLRNRLATAEEQLLASTSQVQSASLQASQQAESLKTQLHNVASQRDAAYMQVASFQDQCQQYATSLSNLQLVLEQFQKEKDSQVASETERFQEEARQLKKRAESLEKELQQSKTELEEASDGLAAASRLSEQLDKKEEAIEALREEVHHRETALSKAEEEIHKLTSNTEAKVDRVLMKNLLLGYFHTPDRNRLDAIHAIGSVLGFSHEDFHKIEESQGGGWMSSLFRRGRSPSSSSPPTTPVRGAQKGPNQSFSQLFVKFLEVESTPPPAPVRLPAEEMAREAQERHHIKEARSKPAFNPFTAPRHVSMPIAVGTAATAMASSSSSHLLMSPPSPGSGTATFPVFAPFSSSAGEAGALGPSHNSSSAILKDVLGSR